MGLGWNTLDQTVQEANNFEDFRSNEWEKLKKFLKKIDSSSEKSQLRKQIEELQKQIASLQYGKKILSSSKRQSFVF